MKFERLLEGRDHLWAVRDMSKSKNELAILLDTWNDINYLMTFFSENIDDLKNYFHIQKISEAIDDTIDDAEELESLILDVPFTDNLDELFKPLATSDMTIRELSRNKARNWDRPGHAS